MKKQGMLGGIVFNLCPHCHQGKVFSGFVKIHHQCPSCGFLIMKEEGYFIGAMIASYFLSFFSAVPLFLFGYFVLETDVITLILLSCAQIVLFGPIFYRVSALFWLWLETDLQAKLDAADQKKRR